MGTPLDERGEPVYRNLSQERQLSNGKDSSEEEGTMVDNSSVPEIQEKQEHKPRSNSHLTVETAMDFGGNGPDLRQLQSPSQTREKAHRLDDELKLLQVERQVSRANQEEKLKREQSQSRSIGRSRSRRDDTLDDFDIATNPLHETVAIYKPPEHPSTKFAKLIKKIHQSSSIVRYITYIIPPMLILLIPLLLGTFVFKQASVGGVELMWFSIWLEIVWLTLWAGRILSKCLPWPIGILASLFTNNAKKWRDMAKQLELPATLFFWWLGIEVSFLPTMVNHKTDGSKDTASWMVTTNKVLVSLFVGAILNFVEKIIIQLIAISFHQRTYQDRIDLNKFQIGSLTKLYIFSKAKIAMDDSDFEAPSGPGSGARTPGQLLESAQKHTREVFSKFGDVAGRIAGDFSGKQISSSTHPHQVILALLHSTPGSQVLARRLYRTFAREETETVHQDDLKDAFENDEEHEAAFAMFDKDMNGDISMEELEAVCVEIGRERKSITASLKDLDSVVSKLDHVFLFIVLVITLLVFISLISTSAAGVLTSAGSTVLALSWLFSATAQEFLQSCIFVFVKHPFDVGDRVTIYGNTGSMMKGDDYFVKEISLLFTEFKKMEGHVVQAPNSYLNTLFILNQRRSGGLAEAVTITIKFGTTLEQLDQLRQRLLEFVTAEKREYQKNILTELRNVTEVHSLDLNVVFFYKSNWQNEGLRLARRNKFICAMMVCMQELGIEGPRMRFPGQKESYPVYLQNVPHVGTPGAGHGGTADHPEGHKNEQPIVPPLADSRPGANEQIEQPHELFGFDRHPSIMASRTAPRKRGESLSAMHRRVDFSLGMKDIASGDMSGDVYSAREEPRLPRNLDPNIVTDPMRPRSNTSRSSRRSQDVGRSTSLDQGPAARGIARTFTDADAMRPRASIHRNRFFGRNRAGTVDAEAGMVRHMTGIPEQPGTTENSPPQRSDRLDPRSGMISPAAWRMNTNESNLHPQRSADAATVNSQAVTSESSNVDGAPLRFPTRSATEDWEMRTLR